MHIHKNNLSITFPMDTDTWFRCHAAHDRIKGATSLIADFNCNRPMKQIAWHDLFIAPMIGSIPFRPLHICKGPSYLNQVSQS